MFLRSAALLVLTTVAASAAQPAMMSDADKATFKKYCTGDYLSYCGDLAPNSPEVTACFKANMTKLAPDCRTAINAFQRKSRTARAGN